MKYYLLSALIVFCYACKPEPKAPAPATPGPATEATPDYSHLAQPKLEAALAEVSTQTLRQLDRYTPRTHRYNCPEILDEGTLKGYFDGDTLRYIDHRFQNGKFASSNHQYYVSGERLHKVVMVDLKKNFEIRDTTGGAYIVTETTVLFDDAGQAHCMQKKFAVGKESDIATVGADISAKPLPCQKPEAITKKYEFILANMENKAFKDGQCFF